MTGKFFIDNKKKIKTVLLLSQWKKDDKHDRVIFNLQDKKN